MRHIEVVLRPTRHDDDAEIQRIMAFYEQHRTPNVVLHSDDEHRSAAARGLHFVVLHEDAIVAATLVVPVSDTVYLEGGNTVVAPEFRNFGLHRLLIRTRAVAVFADGTHSIFVIGADPENNTVSYNNLVREGFQPLASVDPAFYALCEKCDKRPSPPRLCCCTFMFLDDETHRQAVAKFLESTPETVVRRKSDELRVRTEYLWATRLELRRELERFAGVNYN